VAAEPDAGDEEQRDEEGEEPAAADAAARRAGVGGVHLRQSTVLRQIWNI
jgi:hypothetical protein